MTVLSAAILSAQTTPPGKGLGRIAASDAELQAQVAAHRHALLIGVDRFRNPDGHKRLDPLPEVRNDLAELERALKGVGFSVEAMHSETEVKPNKDNILVKIGQMNKQTYDNDTVLVYFTGHGQGEYLYTYNYNPQGTPGDTCLSVSDLTRKIKKDSLAARKILVVDACHSGVAVDGDTKAKEGELAALNFNALDRMSDAGFFVLASCQPGERSWIDKKEKRSYFTKHFIAGLEGAADGAANASKDCRIDLIDLYKYIQKAADAEVRSEVRDENGQPVTQRARMRTEGAPMVYLASVEGCRMIEPLTDAELEEVRRLLEELRRQSMANQKETQRLARQRDALEETSRTVHEQLRILKEMIEDYRRRSRDLDQRERDNLADLKQQSVELEKRSQELDALRQDLDRRSRAIAEKEEEIIRQGSSLEQHMDASMAIAGAGDEGDTTGGTIVEPRQHAGPPPEILIESIGYRLRYIPPGEFMMGSPSGFLGIIGGERGRDSDEDLHRVKLTEGYYIGVTEVTNGQFVQFLNAVNRRGTKEEPWFETKSEDSSSHIVGETGSYRVEKGFEEHPVIEVSWWGAAAFARWLSEQGHGRFRLPTEAEWERACRAGSQTAFANGKITVTGCGKDANLDLMGWYCGNVGGKTHPVAQKQANAWGLYDLHGNVWEWVADSANWDKGVRTDTYRDGIENPFSETGARRVIRGGSWDNYARHCRCAFRYADLPGSRFSHLGFRLAGSP